MKTGEKIWLVILVAMVTIFETLVIAGGIESFALPAITNICKQTYTVDCTQLMEAFPEFTQQTCENYYAQQANNACAGYGRGWFYFAMAFIASFFSIITINIFSYFRKKRALPVAITILFVVLLIAIKFSLYFAIFPVLEFVSSIFMIGGISWLGAAIILGIINFFVFQFFNLISIPIMRFTKVEVTDDDDDGILAMAS